jgi:hypothetical protein
LFVGAVPVGGTLVDLGGGALVGAVPSSSLFLLSLGSLPLLYLSILRRNSESEGEDSGEFGRLLFPPGLMLLVRI